MSNIKIRELTDLETNERVPQNWLATATSEEAGLDRFTRRATWIDVFSGVAPIYSGEFNFGNFTGGLQLSGNDVLTGVPIATYTSLGIVQIGENLSITEDGVLSTFPEYDLPPATRSTLGGIIVGDALEIDENGTLDYDLPIAKKEASPLPAIGGVIVGENLSVDPFGVISATGNYILPTATETRLGGIKVGDHLQVKTNGELSVKEGSHTVTGVVKIGDTLTFTGDNYLSYVLPPAVEFDGSNTRPLGGVIIGDNLTVDDGVLHGNPDYELPIASTTILGGIKVGDNLTIDEDGKLNAPGAFELECATATQLGGIKVGDYLSVSNDCKLSPDIMGGATESGDGDPGIVPQPLSDSKDYIKVLRGDGSWVRICHTQTDAPVNPKDGTLWFDTSVMEMYVYVKSEDAWFQANGPACCGDPVENPGSGGGSCSSGNNFCVMSQNLAVAFNASTNTWYEQPIAETRTIVGSNGNFCVMSQNRAIAFNASTNTWYEQPIVETTTIVGSNGNFCVISQNRAIAFNASTNTWYEKPIVETRTIVGSNGNFCVMSQNRAVAFNASTNTWYEQPIVDTRTIVGSNGDFCVISQNLAVAFNASTNTWYEKPIVETRTIVGSSLECGEVLPDPETISNLNWHPSLSQ